MIRVEGLSRRYGELIAVDDLSFVAEPGRVTGLLGPNGAGKSTTLRMICGCLGPSDGRVEVAGHDVVRDPRTARASLGYLPESPPLYLDMRVRDYVDHAARLRRVPRGERADAVRFAIERSGLSDVAHRLVGHLSKGYRQRVGLAQALVHRPPVLVLDEPTHGLDPRQMASMRELLVSLKDEHTVLLSTHLLAEATALCDELVILAGGRLVAAGPEQELRRRLLGSSRVRIRVRERAGAASALASVDGVDAVEESDELLFVSLAAEAGPEVLAALNAAAVPFGLLESGAADTLETLFLKAVAS